ncbi:hypothetical protein Agabi119p4_459 [Agaricus bisporus var. burnettii]|uniref:SGS domain-containing protein n=1 Tax=Agaricus bisporus var. burnettii TaxID=192524 RepID=A0A8H7FAS6_AGABI|nr:hypothetical protein Agabi119p4_459 [Agaricus bisporus var. burnettii]
MSTPRHEFYETDEKIILSVFDRNADPDKVKITYQPRAVTYAHAPISLAKSKSKSLSSNAFKDDGPVLSVMLLIHWQTRLPPLLRQLHRLRLEKSTEEDPNVGGDSTLNTFFQKIYADADEDTRRAMMKSFSESGGTTLSTNWDEVQKKQVEVKPPSGSVYKKWG